MKKKLAIACTMLLAASLMGCGGGSAGTSAGTADTGAAETAATESTGSAAGPVQVDLWHYFDQADQPMIEALVKEYNEMQDEIEIKATYVAREELMNQYTIGAVSGELPDIGMVDSPDMASYISLGVFDNITEELNSWGEIESFYDGPLASCMDADSNLYGLPQNSNCLALACNMDALKAAGYDHVPTSLDEFKEMVEATTDAADSVYGFAMCCISTEEGTFQILPWVCATRGGVKGTVSDITSASCVEGLSVLGEFSSNGWMSKESVNWTQADAYNQFVSGKAAMAELGTWQLATITDDVNGAFNYQLCLLPTGDEGTSTSTIGGENFGVCTGSANKEGCVEFLKWLCSAEQQSSWCAGAGKMPTRSDVSVEYSYEQEGFAVFQDEMNYAMARGPHAEWPTISEAIYTATQDVIISGADAKTALETAAGKIKPIIEASPLPEQ